MGIVTMAVVSMAAGCALCLAGSPALSAAPGAMVPVSRILTDDVLAGLMEGDDPALSLATPTISDTGWLGGGPFDVPADALVVLTPGTDDTTLYRRIDAMRGGLHTVLVEHPQSLGPFISGRSGHVLPLFAPTYDQSLGVAVAHNLEAMAALDEVAGRPTVVYTGYSQGAEAVGQAAEKSYAEGLFGTPGTQIVLVSDPRSPWGLKHWASGNTVVSLAFSLVGATPNGARDPADTGEDLQVTSVVIDGDPIANVQWDRYRPLASLVVNLAGFFAIHLGLGTEHYGNLDEIDDRDVLHSSDGNTTYLIHHAQHPLTQLAQMIGGVGGVRFTESQVDQIEQVSRRFYPLQQPERERAAVPVVSAAPELVSDGDAETEPADDPAVEEPQEFRDDDPERRRTTRAGLNATDGDDEEESATDTEASTNPDLDIGSADAEADTDESADPESLTGADESDQRPSQDPDPQAA